MIPLCRPATFTVILLAFVGGLRSFDLIWTMTGGGPGFTTDVLASTIYKQYQAGFYGLATAGNVVMFLLVVLLAYPMQRYSPDTSFDCEQESIRRYRLVALLVAIVIFRRPVHFHRDDGDQDRDPTPQK